jgi:glycosyltransferase involved in cell wall biosynthesis
MKICVVSFNIVPYYHRSSHGQYGGAEVQAAVLADAFAAAGAEVCLVVRDLGDARLPYPAYNAFRSGDGVPGLRFFHPRLPGVFAALRRADADIYFQHCAGIETGLTAMHCNRHRGKFVYFAGSDTDFSLRDVRVSGLRDKTIFFWGVKHADAIVAQNERQAQLCRDQLHRDAVVIPTAVAVSDIDPSQTDGSVVWVGALREVKGPLAFVRLAEAMPERRFVMIGGEIESEAAFAAGVRGEAEKVKNLTLTGRIPRDEVDAYLRRAALLVNTSRVEGFPNAFLEAWQHGLPVVSFVDVDGMIEDEGIGVVCAGAGEMAAAVERLLDDDDRRAIMGTRARRLIEDRYGAPTLAQRYLSLFERLVGHGA